MGATPRWVGYVAVDDVDARPSGSSVLAEPYMCRRQTAISAALPWWPIRKWRRFALVEGLRPGQPEISEHERGRGASAGMSCLPLTGDKAFAFYGEVFGWRKADAEILPGCPRTSVFAAGGRTVGGMFTKLAREPVPFWLYYFNVGDIDAALRAGEEQAAAGSPWARTNCPAAAVSPDASILRAPCSRCRVSEAWTAPAAA